MRYYIDSHNVTDYNRNIEDLQAFWLFGILVAGKNSEVQARKLASFLELANHYMLTPFDYIRELVKEDVLDNFTRFHKLGQYTRINRAFEDSMRLDLKTATVERLEEVHGVGPKTSRLFLLHTREHQQYAVLDTHILKWIGKTLDVTVPKATPSGKKYRYLENLFLNRCAMKGVSPAELDLHIWSTYNRG